MRFVTSLAVGLMVAGPTYAATYTYDFVATHIVPSIDSADDTSVLSIADEARGFDTLTGTITFSDVVLSSSPTETIYDAPSLLINELSTPTDVPISALRVREIASQDDLGILRVEPTDLYVNYNAIGMIWIDNGKTALDGADPLASLDISDFEIAQLFFLNQRNEGFGLFATERTNFRVTSLELQAVPLPAGGALLPIGLLGLAMFRRRVKSA